MNRPALSVLCGLVYLLTGLGAASAGQIAADAGYCKVSSLPLDRSNALVGIRLSRTSFFGITREYSTASIERIPFYATSTDENLSHPPFPLPSPQFLDKVVGSNGRVVLVGNSPLISSVCPTKGRVVFERAWLSNGTEENFSSSVDSDVLPDVLPAYFDSTGCRLSSPLDVLVRLKIKTSGEGGSVSVEGETQGQFACLTRELQLWTFSMHCGGELPWSPRWRSSFAFIRKKRYPPILSHRNSFERAPRRVLRRCTSCSVRTMWITGASFTQGTVAQRRPFARIVQGAMRSPKIGLYRPARIWKSHAE